MADATNNPQDDLTPEQAARIDAALGETIGESIRADRPGEWDETVARASQGLIPSQPMPAELRQRIIAQAGEHLPPPRSIKRPLASQPRHGAPWWFVIAGPIAAAAAVAMYFTVRPTQTTALPPVAMQLDEQARQWLSRNSQVKPVTFAALGENALGKGDVIWSDRDQTGYMRFASLPPNDPEEWQYQLWIFDADRDERYPVDGGVFDIPAKGSGVVPIQPKIRVNQATLFAITRERPGGVVVSDRTQLVLLAKMNG